MSYTRLTEAERYDIYEMKKEGASSAEIAQALGRDKSTICREVSRNSGDRGYRPKQAQEKSTARMRKRRGGKMICEIGWLRCQELLRTAHSPVQAAGRSILEGFASISHETVYKRIYEDKSRGGVLWKNLRCKKKRRKRYGSGRQKRGQIPNRVGIEKRCPRVEARASVGHWEGDTVIGRNRRYAFVTLVERKTGYALVRKIHQKTAKNVSEAIIEALAGIKSLVRTITFDNGLEFADHVAISRAIDAKVYFADPYSSWQRGTNENWNGLLRQFYPKKSCFSRVSEDQLMGCQHALNNRARKRLAFKTPYEALLPSAKRAGVALAL